MSCVQLALLMVRGESFMETGDIGLKQDYLSAVKDLAALELHLQRTAAKTGEEQYVDILREVRKLRSKHLMRLIGDTKLKGESWCMAKHLLLASKQLSEVADKYIDQGYNANALELYKDCLDLDGVFNLIIKIGGNNGDNGQPEKQD